MCGPGASRPAPPEGMTAIADLPPPEIVSSRRTYTRQAWPRCGHQASRDKQDQRRLHDLGHLDVWCPRALVVPYAQPYCTKCRKYFNADLADLAPPGSQYTPRVMDLAVRLVVEDGLPYRPARWHLWRAHRVFGPCATLQNWGEAGGKKAQGRMDTDVLEWTLADFAGYVAADELYEGPFCLLSAVDQRRSKRLLYDVFEHDPAHDDIRAFLGRLKAALTARALPLLGITTAGAALYPGPLAAIFGGVRPQLCEVHMVADVGKAVLGAVASARKRLAAKHPTLPQGRPRTKAAKAAARKKKPLEQQRGDLFTHRYLFAQPHLRLTERKKVWRMPRGVPQLQQRRASMAQVDALFDRRCRSQTALDKRATLRRRVQRFKALGDTLKKRFAPTLEKALTLLADKVLPSTSKAVERGNRRYRKMQKRV